MMYPHLREGTSWLRGLGTGKAISRDVSAFPATDKKDWQC